MRISINGFGRIGRAFFRLAFEESDIQIVAINDLADLENLAYLLKNDTVYGKFDKKIETRENLLVIDGKEIPFYQERDPKNLPWKDLEVDIAVEATGAFSDYIKARAHIEAGAKKVIITAPAKGEEDKEGKTVLIGINDQDLAKFDVVSNGSCTTNAVAPVMKILQEKIGIKKAVLNTIHAYTSTQRLVDGPNSKDLRRGRAASQNIVPSSTGAAKCVGKVMKDLDGKFDGIALRVPVVCGSIADITFISEKDTSVEEINKIFKEASGEKNWEGIMEATNEQLVSSDIIKTIVPAIVDLSFTKVIDRDLVKILVWYDNEWAYSWTLLQQIKKLSLI
jgi:glyceraldehyde 3-phosphate dehydrogenase